MDEETNDDFQIHADVSAKSRELAKAQRFLEAFLNGYASTSTQIGFQLGETLERQPDGQSCFFASAMAMARALGLSQSDFRQVVLDMTNQARAMRIVDDYGLDPTRIKEVNEILEQIGLTADSVIVTPHLMDPDETRGLGHRLKQNLEMGNGIAMLRSSQGHFVLLHERQVGGMNRVYDPLQGQDILETDRLIGQNVGQISNNLISRSSQGNLIFLKPLKPIQTQEKQTDFVIHRSY